MAEVADAEHGTDERAEQGTRQEDQHHDSHRPMSRGTLAVCTMPDEFGKLASSYMADCFVLTLEARHVFIVKAGGSRLQLRTMLCIVHKLRTINALSFPGLPCRGTPRKLAWQCAQVMYMSTSVL